MESGFEKGTLTSKLASFNRKEQLKHEDNKIRNFFGTTALALP
jgi:hypothetical protein